MVHPRVVLDPKTASGYMKVAVQTLARWRVEGGGPPFLKLGTVIRYDQSEIDLWLDTHRQRSTTDTRAATALRKRDTG